MEVHHHPQLHHKAKPLKEYILEYIMIVLAVTTGFFAESLREHINDRSKEKEYLFAMRNELKFDTSQYHQVLQKIIYLKPLLDSLYYNVKDATGHHYQLEGKWNTPVNETRVLYQPTIPTIEQLKSSGNLRLIGNRDLLRKIMQYESHIDGELKLQVQNITSATEKIFRLEDELCDESEFNRMMSKNMQDSSAQFNMMNGLNYNMVILTRDPIRMNEFANSFANYKSRGWGYYTMMNTANQLAVDLIGAINEEYNFDKE